MKTPSMKNTSNEVYTEWIQPSERAIITLNHRFKLKKKEKARKKQNKKEINTKSAQR